MSLKNLKIKKTYSSDFDDILYDFYIPVLEKSNEYNRLAGFFSSTSLAIAAKGILGLIKSKGFLRLIVSPKLNKKDLEIIIDSQEKQEKYIEEKMVGELEALEDEFVRDHVAALGWMIAKNMLEIKVAIVFDNKGIPLSYEDIQQSGIFHQKVGILRDSQGDTITFSGSVNETASGWLDNIEEFKVFRSWETSEEDYVKSDIEKFNKFWSNQSLRVKVIDIPYAVKEKLITIAPNDIEELNLKKWLIKKVIEKKKIIKLWNHQKQAIKKWVDNDKKGIFEMATGTGKTFTALGCVKRVQENEENLVTVITCPLGHLVQQWKREIKKYGIEYDTLIIADSSNPSWRDISTDSLIDISLGYKNKVIILTTHRTFSSDGFARVIRDNKSGFRIFLIGDEVHGLGAEKSREGLINEYDFKLGLSATPKRWFDTVGTNAIYNYFGGVVYEFTLENAINTINPATGETHLTPYGYITKFVSLSTEELEEYIHMTRVLATKFNKAKNDEERDVFLKNLLFKRADIIKNAINKYEILEEILNEIGNSIKWTIIYCSPQQIDRVMNIINEQGIVVHRFTMDEGTTPERRFNNLSERDFLLQKFAEGKYQVLVAMKCLDEGVDVPPAKTAILMASSGNPREYIQRIGRIIRRYKGKTEATIYDIVVIPSFEMIPPELRNIEWTIFKKELKRYEEIAKIANNGAKALKSIYDIKNKLMEERNG